MSDFVFGVIIGCFAATMFWFALVAAYDAGRKVGGK